MATLSTHVLDAGTGTPPQGFLVPLERRDVLIDAPWARPGRRIGVGRRVGRVAQSDAGEISGCDQAVHHRRWGPVPARDVTEEEPHRDPAARRRLTGEIWIALGLSLGASAVYSVVSLTAKLTAGRSLSSQTSTLNGSESVREYLDLTYQLLGIVFTLVPVALVLWLLAADTPRVARRLGLDRNRWGRDALYGAGLAAAMGLPGLGVYYLGHQLGVTTTIVASGLDAHWWTIPVLVLQAVKNAVLEEVIVVGYLLTRLRRLAWSWPAATAAGAVLRGSYHLYQGFGSFVGNAIMGVVFAEWFRRGGRVWPLIVAHTILDVVSFVGYDLAKTSVLARLGLA